MNVEIVEFYPIERKEEKDFLTGTLRIRLPDIKLQILGIFVTKNKDSWFFALPGRKGIDHKTGNAVRYPFIAFDDRQMQKELIEALREKVPAFIGKRLADTENPLVFPPKRRNPEDKAGIAANEGVVVEKREERQERQNLAIAGKVWQDPPPRKDIYNRKRK